MSTHELPNWFAKVFFVAPRTWHNTEKNPPTQSSVGPTGRPYDKSLSGHPYICSSSLGSYLSYPTRWNIPVRFVTYATSCVHPRFFLLAAHKPRFRENVMWFRSINRYGLQLESNLASQETFAEARKHYCRAYYWIWMHGCAFSNAHSTKRIRAAILNIEFELLIRCRCNLYWKNRHLVVWARRNCGRNMCRGSWKTCYARTE